MSTQNHKPVTTSDILNNVSSDQSSDQSSVALLAKEEVLLTKEDPSPSSTTNPTFHKSNNLFSSATRARCGKVARLPKEIRDQLNVMLLDGVPHAQIIQRLLQTFGSNNDETPADTKSNVLPLDPTAPSSPHESCITHQSSDQSSVALLAKEDHESSTTEPALGHPVSPALAHPVSSIEHPESAVGHPASSIQYQEALLALTPLNITNWKKFGGYRDWLRDQQRIQECKIRHELTLDLAQSSEGLASYQAAPKVAVAQICQTIIDLGPEGIKDAMKDSPLNCFRLLNALARLVNSGLKCEQVVAQQRPVPEKRAGFTAPVIEKMENALNMM